MTPGLVINHKASRSDHTEVVNSEVGREGSTLFVSKFFVWSFGVAQNRTIFSPCRYSLLSTPQLTGRQSGALRQLRGRSISSLSSGNLIFVAFLPVDRRRNREKGSGWHHTGNNLSTMAAIDAEIGIRGKHHGIGKCFGHTHEAGIGEAHGNISVFPQQPQHGFHIIVKIEIYEQCTALQQSAERRCPTPAKKVESFG
jgi:hypothetical protein